MSNKCMTCKWWGERPLIIEGRVTPFRECLRTRINGQEGYMYSIGDAECDEDINGWEAADGRFYR